MSAVVAVVEIDTLERLLEWVTDLDRGNSDEPVEVILKQPERPSEQWRLEIYDDYRE